MDKRASKSNADSKLEPIEALSCTLEARPEGMQSLNVTEHGATVQAAVRSAAQEARTDDRLADLGTSSHR